MYNFPNVESVISDLWEIESETKWTGRDVSNEEGARLAFSRHVKLLLEKLKDCCSDIQCGYGAVTGLELDHFLPVAEVGMAFNKIVPTKRHSINSLVAESLSTYSPQNNKKIILIDQPNNKKTYKGITKSEQMAILPLIGHGELFGYICLYAYNIAFDKKTLDILNLSQPIISRLLAESIFSLRVWEVSNTFSSNGDSLNKIYNKIVSKSAKIFAATGSILRIYDKLTNSLNVVDFEIVPGAERIANFLISDDSTAEEIVREVFEDKDYGWTAGMLPHGESAELTGTPITQIKETELKRQGITAYCVFRLEATNVETGETEKLGSLGIFHGNTARFSLRDIALAKSFAQQASNIIALRRGTDILIKKNSKLQELNKKIDETNLNLLKDSQLFTRVEVVSLLAHDLGHKALGAQNAFENYTDSVRKTIREKRSFDSLQSQTSSTQNSLQEVTASLSNINNLFGREGDHAKIEFDLKSLCEEVFRTLNDAMNRNKCVPENTIPQGIVVFGNRGVLLQVLFNMVINSIDAQRSRRSPRSNTIRMSLHQTSAGIRDTSRLEIRVSDEGPGIDRIRFPDPNDIFKLGESSKEKGTGRGLPISRNLISSYYGGNITLVDPEHALFQISIPRRTN